MKENLLRKKFLFVMSCLVAITTLALFGKMSGAEVAGVISAVGVVFLGGQSYVDSKKTPAA